jgi:hypothetical protein
MFNLPVQHIAVSVIIQYCQICSGRVSRLLFASIDSHPVLDVTRRSSQREIRDAKRFGRLSRALLLTIDHFNTSVSIPKCNTFSFPDLF